MLDMFTYAKFYSIVYVNQFNSSNTMEYSNNMAMKPVFTSILHISYMCLVCFVKQAFFGYYTLHHFHVGVNRERRDNDERERKIGVNRQRYGWGTYD